MLEMIKETDGAIITFRIKGILDISTTNIISSNLDTLEEGLTMLILDFSGIEFLDSTGIGSVINAIHLSGEKNFKLQLQGTNEMTDQVFEMVGLYEILAQFGGEAV